MNIINRYMSVLDDYEYISFDVFDTLFFRTISYPSLVFSIIEHKYNKDGNSVIKNFRYERTKAEAKAHTSLEDVTLESIYERLPYDKETKLKLLRLELQCEEDMLIANDEMITLLKWCYSSNKKVVIISDMYLPRTFFDNIFTKNGISYYRFYLSCELGVSKHTGTIYPYVLQDLNISPSKMIHIGDNLLSDVEQAQNNDIYSLLYEKANFNIKQYLKPIRKTVFQRILFKFYAIFHISYRFEYSYEALLHDYLYCLNNIQQCGAISEYRIGFTILGPLLFSFCQWIHKVKDEENIEKLIFLAREGYLIKEVYDLMYPDDIEFTFYARLNKNLLRLPLSSGCNGVDNFLLALPTRETYSWDNILDYLYISNKKFFFNLLKTKFPFINFNQQFSLLDLNENKYRKVLEFILHQTESNNDSQNAMLLAYLKKMGFLNSKCGIVNNSLKGSGQALLEKFLTDNGVEPRIFGLQFFGQAECFNNLKGKFRAWINESCDKHIVGKNFPVLIFEHLLFEANGTSKYFELVNGKENVKCDIPRNEKYNFSKIKRIQNHALNFVSYHNNHLNLDLRYVGYYMLCKLGHNPYVNDAILVGNLWDDDIEADKKITNFHYQISLAKIFKKTGIGWVEGFSKISYFPLYYRLLRCIKNIFKKILIK